MFKSRLLSLLLVASFSVMVLNAEEEGSAETPEEDALCEVAVDSDSNAGFQSDTDDLSNLAEACASEEDELERGFDPCLINANLPACKPKDESEESTPSTSESEQPSEK